VKLNIKQIGNEILQLVIENLHGYRMHRTLQSSNPRETFEARSEKGTSFKTRVGYFLA
jgi:hypothetical protein